MKVGGEHVAHVHTICSRCFPAKISRRYRLHGVKLHAQPLALHELAGSIGGESGACGGCTDMLLQRQRQRQAVSGNTTRSEWSKEEGGSEAEGGSGAYKLRTANTCSPPWLMMACTVAKSSS